MLQIVNPASSDAKSPPSSAEDPPLSEAAWTALSNLQRPRLSPLQIGIPAAFVDLFTLTLAFWFAAHAGTEGEALALTARSLICALAVVGILQLLGSYRLKALSSLLSGLSRVAALAIVTGLLPALVQGNAVSIGRLCVFLGIFVLPGRLLIAAMARWAIDYRLTERRAVVIGGGPAAAELVKGIVAAGTDIRICGLFDDRSGERSPPAVAGIPKLGTTKELISFARAAEIDMAIVTLPLTAQVRIREILEPIKVLPIDLRLSAYSSDLQFRRKPNEALIRVMGRPISDLGALSKRSLDLIGASGALLVLAIPMLLTAVMIKLDSPGPVFFRQKRHGYNHRPVDVLKFRSMRSDDCDADARKIVTKGDPRVTRVGRFIRRFSIDELPQLFNVMTGELSLVGPRPHALIALSSQQIAFADMVDGYAARHKLRPGITGWAQINGWRGEIDDPDKLRRRFEHDLHYIENWSIWLDLKILALTPIRIFDAHGAY